MALRICCWKDLNCFFDIFFLELDPSAAGLLCWLYICDPLFICVSYSCMLLFILFSFLSRKIMNCWSVFNWCFGRVGVVSAPTFCGGCGLRFAFVLGDGPPYNVDC